MRLFFCKLTNKKTSLGVTVGIKVWTEETGHRQGLRVRQVRAVSVYSMSVSGFFFSSPKCEQPRITKSLSTTSSERRLSADLKLKRVAESYIGLKSGEAAWDTASTPSAAPWPSSALRRPL